MNSFSGNTSLLYINSIFQLLQLRRDKPRHQFYKIATYDRQIDRKDSRIWQIALYYYYTKLK